MRAVFIGAGALTTATARRLLKHGHDVVVIEIDAERIAELSDELSCGFIHGDGSKPAILREADPKSTDLLYCLTGNDQTNILASLVGRSLGFGRIVTKIIDPEYEHVCVELGLEELIIPARTIGRYLADVLPGRELFELSAMIKDEARVFSFIARPEDAGPVKDLDLPSGARACFYYRDERFELIEANTKLIPGDEVVIITHSKHLPALFERWGIKSHRPNPCFL